MAEICQFPRSIWDANLTDYLTEVLWFQSSMGWVKSGTAAAIVVKLREHRKKVVERCTLPIKME